MREPNSLFALPIAMLALTAIGVGQEPEPGRAPRSHPPKDAAKTVSIVKLDALVGAKVVPIAATPSGGSGSESGAAEAAADKKGGGAPLGEIVDFVVDQEGRIRDAVVLAAASGARPRQVAVPFREFEWRTGEACFGIRLSESELAARATFDPERVAGGNKAPTDGKSPGDGKSESGDAGKARTPQHVLATKLAAARIDARDGELGEPEHVLVEVSGGNLAFAELSRVGVLGVGAKTCHVPWSALAMMIDDKGLCLSLTKGKNVLDAAPSPKGADSVADASYRAELYEAFGVQIPSWDRAAAEARKGGKTTGKR